MSLLRKMFFDELLAKCKRIILKIRDSKHPRKSKNMRILKKCEYCENKSLCFHFLLTKHDLKQKLVFYNQEGHIISSHGLKSFEIDTFGKKGMITDIQQSDILLQEWLKILT